MTREEQANADLGRTDFSKGTNIFLTVFFLFVMTAVPLVQSGIDRLNETGVRTSIVRGLWGDIEASSYGFVFSRIRVTSARLLDILEQYETALQENSFLTLELLPKVQMVMTGILRGGNETAYCGREGWAFSRLDLDYLAGKPFMDKGVQRKRRQAGRENRRGVEPDPASAIIEFQQALARRGIHLIVMPTPIKPMIYPEKFSRIFENVKGPLQNPSYAEVVSRLQKAGIPVFDVSAELFKAKSGTKSIYLKTDTHWTPAGMSLAAKSLAEFLLKHYGTLLCDPEVSYEKIDKQIVNTGDAIRVFRLDDSKVFYAPESIIIEQIFAGPRPFPIDKDAQILVLGDSFSNIYSLDGMGWGDHAGFVEHLAYYLKKPVDAITQNDAGAFATRQALSLEQQRGNDRLRNKKIVVYQFAMRELSTGDWKTGFDYSLGERADVYQERKLTVTAEVAAILPVPSPSSAPYKDCYIPLHLKNIFGTPPALAEAGIIVFVWGLLDGQYTDYNSLKKGQEVTLDLVPFKSVQDKVNAYKHNEFTDTERLRLPVYWGDPRMPSGATVSDGAGGNAWSLTMADHISSPPKRTRNPSVEPPELSAYLDFLEDEVRRGTPVIQGRDGWLYLPSELSHVSTGYFWNDSAAVASRVANQENSDPLVAIVDFKNQLAQAGIELYLVPVPPKISVCPYVRKDEAWDGERNRVDMYNRLFYDELERNGVHVIDLYDSFSGCRRQSDGPVFCRQDTHWSPTGCRLAASQIAARVKTLPFYKDTQKRTYVISNPTVIQMAGDLAERLDGDKFEKETVTLFPVSQSEPDRLVPVSPDRQSPVLLLGDSHTLVFTEGGDMHATASGLADYLAYELGFPVDLLGIRGSGATASRVAVFRRGDNLRGKKVVIWCFSSREFTQSASGFVTVPVFQ